MTTKLFLLCLLLSTAKFIEAGVEVGDYYFSFPLKLDWMGALRFCTYHGMYLVDIPTDVENAKIMNAIERATNSTPEIGKTFLWTSGTRLSNGFEYYWATTGHPMTFADWAPEQPNNIVAEECLLLWNDHKFKFADFGCHHKLTFMCRKSYVSPFIRHRVCNN